MTPDAFHDRLIAIVTKLPGAYEDRPWGSVHCKVDGKIFVGWGRTEDGEMSMGIRVPIAEQLDLVENDPRFTIAKYVGKYGGVDMRIGRSPDWREVERYIVQSYRLIAPKKRLRELDAMTSGASGADAKAAPTRSASRASSKRAASPAKKPVGERAASAAKKPAPKRGVKPTTKRASRG